MIETFVALLLAHALADFVFQTNRMAANKRQPLMLALHFATVYATLVAATGSLHLALLALALVHVGIDIGKLALASALKGREALALFLGDQALHLASLLALALWFPDLWSQGLWASDVTGADGGILGTGFWAEASPLPPLPALMALAAGLILATRAGGFAVGLLMQPFAERLPPEVTAESLPGAGRVIGLLERGLIFTLVLLGQPEGVGLLMAAKSILRFGAVKDDRALSEYVIIGTLASVGWALAAGYGTLALLPHLPPIGFSPVLP